MASVLKLGIVSPLLWVAGEKSEMAEFQGMGRTGQKYTVITPNSSPSKGLSQALNKGESLVLRELQCRVMNSREIIYIGAQVTCGASQVAQWGKNLSANAGDVGEGGLIPWLGRSPGVGNGNMLQYSCLGNFMDRGA